MLIMAFRIALRALARNKLRSFLTMLGIIIGVGAVIAMVAIGEGAKKKVQEQIASLGTNLLVILPGTVTLGGARTGFGGRQSLVPSDAKAIMDEIPIVSGASPVLRQVQQVIAGIKTGPHRLKEWLRSFNGFGSGKFAKDVFSARRM